MPARECRGKVLLELFQKLTVSRGRASCGTAQSAKSLMLPIARRGEKQSGGLFFVGNPRRGFPSAKHKMIKVSNMIPQLSVKRERLYVLPDGKQPSPGDGLSENGIADQSAFIKYYLRGRF